MKFFFLECVNTQDTTEELALQSREREEDVKFLKWLAYLQLSLDYCTVFRLEKLFTFYFI